MNRECNRCEGAPVTGIGSGIDCKRCGHHWHQMLANRPRYCPRCGTGSWDREPSTPRARRPYHSPNPRWQDKHKVRAAQGTVVGELDKPRVGLPKYYILDERPGLPAPPRMRSKIPAPPMRALHPEEPLQPERVVRAPEPEWPQPSAELAVAAEIGENA